MSQHSPRHTIFAVCYCVPWCHAGKLQAKLPRFLLHWHAICNHKCLQIPSNTYKTPTSIYKHLCDEQSAKHFETLSTFLSQSGLGAGGSLRLCDSVHRFPCWVFSFVFSTRPVSFSAWQGEKILVTNKLLHPQHIISSSRAHAPSTFHEHAERRSWLDRHLSREHGNSERQDKLNPQWFSSWHLDTFEAAIGTTSCGPSGVKHIYKRKKQSNQLIISNLTLKLRYSDHIESTYDIQNWRQNVMTGERSPRRGSDKIIDGRCIAAALCRLTSRIEA